MTSNPITALVLSTEGILRLAHTLKRPIRSKDVLDALGGDPGSVRRDLRRLREDGLTDIASEGAEGTFYDLSATGRAAVEALNRAAGEHVGAAAFLWPHAGFAPNPDNTRKVFKDEVIDSLADSIVEAGGLLQNLVAGPADASGVRMIKDGEVRWRACGRLIAQGRLPTSLADGLPCVERESGLIDDLKVMLIANARREDVSPWEDAKGLKAFKDAAGLSARAVAFALGRAQEGSERGVKDVQEKIATVEKATTENIALHEGGEITWEQLRESVRIAKPTSPAVEPPPAEIPKAETDATTAASATPEDQELSPGARMMLLEIALACELRPYDLKGKLGPTTKMTNAVVLSDRFRSTEAELLAAGMVLFNGGWPVSVTLLRPGLAAANFQAWASPLERRVRRARLDANSMMGEAEAVCLEQEGKYLTEWLNVPPDPIPTVLTDDNALILLEIYEAWKRAGGYSYGSGPDSHGIQVNPEIEPDRIKRLTALKMITATDLETPLADGSVRVKPTTYNRPNAEEALQGRWPDIGQASGRAKALLEIRTALYGAEEAQACKKEKRYATSWLNGPFPVSAAAQAAIDAELQRKQAQEDASARRAAEVQRAEDALAALEAEARTLDPAVLGERIRAMLDARRSPAPWMPSTNRYYGFARSSAGDVANDGAGARLAVLAINALTGCWPAIEAAATSEPSREQFTGWICDHLMRVHGYSEEAAAITAPRVLARELAQGGVAFGEDDFGWTADFAEEYADGWAEDFPPVVAVLNAGSISVPAEHRDNPDPWLAANIVDGEFIGPVHVPLTATPPAGEPITPSTMDEEDEAHAAA